MTKYPCEASNPYGVLQSSDELRLGDTLQQLNIKQANLVDVVVVDDVVYDKERIRELVVQVEVLSRTMIKLDDWINRLPIPTKGACTQLIAIKQVLDTTPQQCLREIEANAGRRGFMAGIDSCDSYLDGYYGGIDFEKYADEYAAKVREGGEI